MAQKRKRGQDDTSSPPNSEGSGDGGDRPGDGGSRGTGGDEPGNATTGRYGNPVRIHREYVERHVGGGQAPTSERYRDALEAWNCLPGAVRRPPVEVPEDDIERDDQDGDARS